MPNEAHERPCITCCEAAPGSGDRSRGRRPLSLKHPARSATFHGVAAGRGLISPASTRRCVTGEHRLQHPTGRQQRPSRVRPFAPVIPARQPGPRMTFPRAAAIALEGGMTAAAPTRAEADQATARTEAVMADPAADQAARQAAAGAERITLDAFRAANPEAARQLDAEMEAAERVPQTAPGLMFWAGARETETGYELEAG